jgi:hypothetical protein
MKCKLELKEEIEMLDKTAPRERLREMAARAIDESGSAGPDACALWKSWVETDDELLLVIARDALDDRALQEVGRARRLLRESIVAEVGSACPEPARPAASYAPGDAHRKVARTGLLQFPLPIAGGVWLCDADLEQAHQARDYYHNQARPFAVRARWLDILIDDRAPTKDKKLLRRGANESKLRDLWERAEREARS